MRVGIAPFALLPALALSACTTDEGPIAASELGRRLFSDSGFSDSDFNSFSCATCHSTEPGDPAVRPGYSLANVAFRESLWGGFEPRLIDAVSFCNVFFMRGDEIDPADEKGRALYEYLVAISPERPSPGLPLTVIANITSVPPGDAARGEEVWNQGCRGCHGEPHTGKGRLTDRVEIVPEASEEYSEEIGVSVDLIVVEKVRHGQFFGVGGIMPPFPLEALSDEDLGALLAYLGV
ncbi:MAG: c-type cytochrome [Deltaproteobacteria bacterium]|nr:c-type cytochrome [Deltaproteobacteria bacterium]